MSHRIKSVVVALALALAGCATRDWVEPVNVADELQRREQLVAQRLQTSTNPKDRQRLRTIETALMAARHAHDHGKADQARADLQVAIDLMDGVR